MGKVKVKMPAARDGFGKRWVEMMDANGNMQLSNDELRTVTLNVVRKQRDDGTVKRDRYVPPEKEHMTRKQFNAREAALIMNKSDAAILDEMEEVEREAGLDMSELEAPWFKYVTAGGDKPQMAKNQPEGEIPF